MTCIRYCVHVHVIVKHEVFSNEQLLKLHRDCAHQLLQLLNYAHFYSFIDFNSYSTCIPPFVQLTHPLNNVTSYVTSCQTTRTYHHHGNKRVQLHFREVTVTKYNNLTVNFWQVFTYLF